MIRRKLGSDPATFKEELMTRGTLFHEDGLTGIRVAGARLELGFDVGNLGDEIRHARGGLLGVNLGEQRLHLLRLVMANAVDHVTRDGVGGDLADFNRFQEVEAPFGPADQQR